MEFKPFNFLYKHLTRQSIRVISPVENVINTTQISVDNYADPIRKTVLKRFPVLFALLVSFGVAATFLGLENIILQYAFFNDNPWFILLLGTTILVFTGKLYKKLS